MNMRRGRVKGNSGAEISLLLSKRFKKAARFNIPILRTNGYQQYICLLLLLLLLVRAK